MCHNKPFRYKKLHHGSVTTVQKYSAVRNTL